MKNNNYSDKIIHLCLKNDEYLKTLQKALVFDEDDVQSFENTYYEMLKEMIETNWQVHRIAEQMRQDEFRCKLKDNVHGGDLYDQC